MNPNASIKPFDLERMFIGEAPPLFLLEIVFRTLFMYIFTLLLLRFIGKRALGELSMFEYIIVFTLGSAVGDPMFYPEVSLLYGMVVLTVVVIAQNISLRLSQKNHPITEFIEGSPTLVVENGRVLEEEIKKQAITKKHVLMLIREQGVKNLNEVQSAYLEPSGKLSIFEKNGSKTKGKSTLPKKI